MWLLLVHISSPRSKAENRVTVTICSMQEDIIKRLDVHIALKSKLAGYWLKWWELRAHTPRNRFFPIPLHTPEPKPRPTQTPSPHCPPGARAPGRPAAPRPCHSLSHHQAGVLQHGQAGHAGLQQVLLAPAAHQHQLPGVLQQQPLLPRHGSAKWRPGGGRRSAQSPPGRCAKWRLLHPGGARGGPLAGRAGTRWAFPGGFCQGAAGRVAGLLSPSQHSPDPRRGMGSFWAGCVCWHPWPRQPASCSPRGSLTPLSARTSRQTLVYLGRC